MQLVNALRTGENGKPYIEGFDFFSVSHTGRIWAVLIDERECGLDIQLAKNCDISSISRRIYAAEDAGRVAALSETDGAKARDEFFRLWTRREALAKAMGGSVYDSYLPEVSSGCVTIDGETYGISGICFPDNEELYAAICVKGEAPDLSGLSFQAI